MVVQLALYFHEVVGLARMVKIKAAVPKIFFTLPDW